MKNNIYTVLYLAFFHVTVYLETIPYQPLELCGTTRESATYHSHVLSVDSRTSGE